MHLSQVVIRCERNCYPASFELTDNTGRPLHRVRRCGCQQSRRMSGDQCPHSGHGRCGDVGSRTRTVEFQGCLPVTSATEPVMSAAWTPRRSRGRGVRLTIPQWTMYVKRLPVMGREGQVKRGGGHHTGQSVQICSKGSSAPLAPSTRTAKSCGLLAKEQGCSEPLLQIWTPTPSAPDERPPPVRPAGAVRPRQETPRIALIGARVK